MSKINHAIHEVHKIERIASRDQWMNRIHPLIKFVLTIVYIFIVVSFSKYDVIGLAAMAVYLMIGYSVAELSFRECLWRLRVILPLVCAVGLANPFLDRAMIDLGFLQVRAGFFSMITLMGKGVFAVLASYLLIATTTIEQICYALRLLHVPSMIVTQILLTYRYITLLLEEVNRITQAYALRAPNQKGVHFKVWGSLTGQLLLRSIDRASEVYESMTLRGYAGEFRYVSEKTSLRLTDILYFLIWMLLFILFRKIPVIYVLGEFVGGILP